MDEEKQVAQEPAENANTPDVQPGQEKKFCVKCGAALEDHQLFCSQCGQKVGKKVTGAAHENKSIKIIVSVVAVLAVVLLAALFARGPQPKSVTLSKSSVTVKAGEKISVSYTIDPAKAKNQTIVWTSSNQSIAEVRDGVISGINEGDCTITATTANGKTDTCEVVVISAGPDLQKIYSEYCKSSFASLALDGSYFSVDTNPNDIEDHIDYDAYLAIVAINKALNLPESVLNKMESTRALDGMQSYSNDELEITWTYHPDNGLEISYALK